LGRTTATLHILGRRTIRNENDGYYKGGGLVPWQCASPMDIMRTAIGEARYPYFEHYNSDRQSPIARETTWKLSDLGHVESVKLKLWGKELITWGGVRDEQEILQ
jgi:hypothetical protein